ncbi:MAG: NAD(P)/FAD-dependent oxidoreductase [Candidatus Lokiarchaeota archaeon]|nr:NAD(P)/FAD-dependent oxidoreductase [Candidatus Lokiarchaeota archaeon]
MIDLSDLDFIIVGGGISGLTIAALLANKGKKVLVLEKEKRVGGRSKLWKKNGFEVDYGIHLSRGAASSVFKKLGLKLRRKKHDLSGGFIIVDKKTPYNILKHARFLIKNKVIKFSELNKSIRFLIAIMLKKYTKFFGLSVGKWLNKVNATKNMKNLFQLVTSILLICPYLDRISLGELVHVIKTMNIRGLARGTFKEILSGLIITIKKNKGEINCLAKVDKILIDEIQKKVIGVSVNNKNLNANYIIIATTPEQITKLIDDKFINASFLNKITNIKPTAGISIDYGLKKIITNNMGFFSRMPPIMGFFENEIGVPQGKQLLSYYLILNSEAFEDKNLIKQKTDLMERFVKKLYPNLEENIEWRRVLNLRRIDGVELNIHQTINKRINNIFPNVKNLFLVGDYTNAPGTGGDIGFNSALKCYKKLNKFKFL